MKILKKIIYTMILSLVILVVAIVIAANSSFVIKKAADTFAPEYHISYTDITGNIFTGVKIDGLKFKDMQISKQIKFSWNPSKILYKHIAISEIRGENIDVDAIKALIASFPESEDNESSAPFPLVVTVGKVYVSVNPFMEQNISFEKTLLEAKEILYAADEVEVGDLRLQLDTGVADLKLHASLEDGEVVVKDLSLHEIDSLALEAMFMPKGEESVTADAQQDEEAETAKKEEPLNPLIPKTAVVEHFLVSLKPRSYKDASIDRLVLNVKELKADILKIIENKEDALSVQDLAVDFSSDMGQIALDAGMQKSVVKIRELNVTKLDTLALKAMFVSDSNETNTTEQNATTAKVDDMNSTAENETPGNNLVPRKVVLESFHTDILPATFDPVHILSFALDAKEIHFDVETLLVEKGKLDIKGQTNLSNISHEAQIKDNYLEGHIVLTPNQPLFEAYAPMIRKEAIGDILIDFNASKERVTADLHAHAKHLLIVKDDENSTDSNGSKPFNVDIDMLHSRVAYRVDGGAVNADTQIRVSTPYAKDINLTNHFEMDGDLSYSGALQAGDILGVDARLTAPAKNLHITYQGDLNTLDTLIESQGLKGYFKVKDLKKGGVFHLETREAIVVREMATLPPELNATRVNAVIDLPVNFQKPVPIRATAKITSNVANVDADLLYGDDTVVKLHTVVTEKSLLRGIDEHIQWHALTPLDTTVKMGEKDISAMLKAPKVTADMRMKPFEGTVNGKIHLAGLLTTLEGKKNGDIVIQSDVGSFKTLLGTVNQFYTMKELPKVDGKLALSMVVDKNSDVSLELSSPQVIVHADRKTDHILDDVDVVLSKKEDTIELRSYQLTYNKMLFYATKPSNIAFKENRVEIPQLWLNDQLKISGGVDLKQMKGEISANAETFHFTHEMIDLDSKIDIVAVLDGNRTDVKGKVTILGGDIHYDLGTKSFPSDSDIVIVQEMKKKEPSPFMDHLSLLINIDSKKPLVYKQGPVDMEANVEMGIHKAVYSDPMIIGSVDLVDGGSYTFEGKKFILDRSHVYLTGDPSKPMLDITVKYRSLRHLITINVTGTPAVPNILFSSVPSLTKEQILSIILFDSEEAAGKNDANAMMKMMGGAMAKSALNNLGVQIDHLVLGEGNSVEVGKKLTDNTTIIYINGEIPKMEVRYHYSPRIEVVVGASEQSESVDVVYRKDFNLKDDDIVIKGR
jgi:translocation and assembly module TamB